MELKLENKDLVLNYINLYSEKKRLESIVVMENIYKIITNNSEFFDGYDNILFDLKDKLKKDTIKETEEELYHIVSWELNRIYTNIVLSCSDEKSVESVFNFLNNNYYDIFKPYYDKKGFFSKDDYEDCVYSVSENFTLEKNIADILVGKWLENIV